MRISATVYIVSVHKVEILIDSKSLIRAGVKINFKMSEVLILQYEAGSSNLA